MTVEKKNRIEKEIYTLVNQKQKINAKMNDTLKTIQMFPEDAESKIHWIEEDAQELERLNKHIEKLNNLIK